MMNKDTPERNNLWNLLAHMCTSSNISHHSGLACDVDKKNLNVIFCRVRQWWCQLAVCDIVGVKMFYITSHNVPDPFQQGLAKAINELKSTDKS